MDNEEEIKSPRCVGILCSCLQILLFTEIFYFYFIFNINIQQAQHASTQNKL